jgi:glycosyltransferase involved in cell wall biosynthesis
MINGKKVIVVMPAYNAEQTLERTVAEIPASVDEVILVDDGSRDGTAQLARRLGLTTLVHPENRGYGGNQKTCYQEALRRGADIVVMVHPDYQYTPKLVPALAHCVASGLFDIALGSRILGGKSLQGGMPRYKYVANRILTLAENLLLGQKLSEYHTGYRAFSRRVLLSLPLQENHDGFVFDNEMLVQAMHFGFQIAEVTCPTRYFDEASSIGFLKSVEYGLGVLGAAVQFRLAKLGAHRPAFLSEHGRRLSDPRQDVREERLPAPGPARLRRKEDRVAPVPAAHHSNGVAQGAVGDEAANAIAPEQANVDAVSYH